MTITRNVSVLTAALLLLSATAHAQDNGIYIGGSFAELSTDFDASVPFQNQTIGEDRGFKLIGGIRPLNRWALEVNYVHFGETDLRLFPVCTPVVGAACPTRAQLDARALSVSAVGFYTVPFFDLFGRAGVARWESDREIEFAAAQTERGTDLTVGVGAQVRLGGFALRLEYERFKLSSDHINSTSLGFTYTFF